MSASHSSAATGAGFGIGAGSGGFSQCEAKSAAIILCAGEKERRIGFAVRLGRIVGSDKKSGTAGVVVRIGSFPLARALLHSWGKFRLVEVMLQQKTVSKKMFPMVFPTRT
jgi:hypothetical protein